MEYRTLDGRYTAKALICGYQSRDHVRQLARIGVE
jgi:hypothetical protein